MLFEDTALAEYSRNLAKLEGQEGKIFKTVLDNKFIKELITHLNTNDQLFKDRIDSLGARLGIYSHATEVISKGRKKQGEFINLHDTGEFYDSWKVIVTENLISIDANPFKDDTNLFDAFGFDILGLTDENLQVLIKETKDFILEYYRKTILPK